MKYRIYIDEVGNSDLNSSENPNHRFLSLTGIILDLEYVQLIVHPQMEKLKYDFFHSHPDDPIIFHRKEMMNACPPFECLKNGQVRNAFNNKLLKLMEFWEYRVISVCLDKKKHKETYNVWRYDPYHYLLAVLLERYVLFLERNGAVGDIMAESRGGKEDLRLKDSFIRLWKNGTDYILPERFQKTLTSSQLKVKSKANNICGLQLADIIAHPSRNEILAAHGFLSALSPFTQIIITLLQEKYDNYEGRIFGKKFL